MQAEILPFRKKKFEDICDQQNRPISGFKRHVPTGNIYLRKSFKKLGIPSLQENTGEKTIGRAKSRAQVIIQQHINRHLGVNDSNLFLRTKGAKTFRDVGQEVLERVTPNRRKKTQLKHKQMIAELVEAFGSYSVDTLTAKHFENWIAGQRKTSHRTSFMDYAKHMNLIMRFAYNERYCQHLIKFKNPDSTSESPGRVYAEREIQDLWGVMSENTRDQFVLSYECMMRLREVLHLTWDRIELTTGKIILRAVDVKTGSKTGKGREFQMSPLAWERMKARRKRVHSPYVFPSRFDRMKPADDNKIAWGNAKKNAGIKGRGRWHDLRHTAITRALLVAKRMPIEVSEYAGVSVGTIQRVYLHSKAEDTRSVSCALSILNPGVNRE